MKRSLLLITAFLAAALIFNQGAIRGNAPAADTVTSARLAVSFGSISFFRNHEYFNQITEGYTLSGSHLKPLLVWAPADNIKVSGGVFASIWSGYEGSPDILPVFSVSLDINRNTRLTVGSLQGPDRHRMFDQHYAQEKVYTSFVEDGVQLLFRGRRIFSDTWVDWERHIFRGDYFREEFTVGESFIYTTGDAGDRVRFEIPVQMLAKHHGGQISSYEGQVETHINLAAGTRMVFNPGEAAMPGEGGTGLSVTAFKYHSMKELAHMPFSNGRALMLAGDHTWRSLFFKAGIWMSENFYSPNGNMMFSSLSDYRDGLTVPRRVLLAGSVNLNRSWSTGLLNLFLGFDWYYDLKENHFDHSLTLHLRIPEKAYGISRRNQ